MARVKFQDGTVINFQGDPNPEQISKAYRQYKSSQSVQTISPEPPLLQRIPGIAKRKGALATKSIFGDVPFIRKMLPKSIQQVEPYSENLPFRGTGLSPEQALFMLARLGRDIGAYSGGETIFGAIPQIQALQKGEKLAKFIGRQLPYALTGATVSGATAGTERPEQIAEQALIGGTTYPIFRKAGETVARNVPKATAQLFQDLASFTSSVPKGAIEVGQREGMSKFFPKKFGYRSEGSVEKLGQNVSTIFGKLRKRLGENVGKVTEKYAKRPIDIKETAKNFEKLLSSERRTDLLVAPRTQQESATLQPAQGIVINAYNELVKLSSGENLNLNLVKNFINRLSDDISRVGRGTTEGRYLSILRDRLSNKIMRAIPTARGRLAYSRANATFSQLMDYGEDLNKIGILESTEKGAGYKRFVAPSPFEIVVKTGEGYEPYERRQAILKFSQFAKKYGYGDIFKEAEKTMAAQALGGGKFQGIRTGIMQNLIGTGAGALGLGLGTGVITRNPYLALMAAGLGGAISTPRGVAALMGGGQNIGRRGLFRPVIRGESIPRFATRKIAPVVLTKEARKKLTGK